MFGMLDNLSVSQCYRLGTFNALLIPNKKNETKLFFSLQNIYQYVQMYKITWNNTSYND